MLKETAYVILIISVLEYSKSLWDPHMKKYMDKLEKLQRKAARFTTSNYDSKAKADGEAVRKLCFIM